MAPVDFEKNIKEKLQEQEIQPTSGAWDRLAEQLKSGSPKQGRNRLFWVYGMAACLLVALGLRMLTGPVGTDPMGQDPVSGQPSVVTTPDTREQDRIQSRPAVAEPSTNTLAGESHLGLPEESGSAPQKHPPADLRKSAQQSRVADRGPGSSTSDIALASAVADTSGLDSQIDRQLDAVLQAVAQREQAGGITVTEAEIDSLLRAAQLRIATSTYRMPRDSVDAQSLLSAAESELDQTFREELFDKLKTGFMKVRTAVADRNN